MRYAVKNNRVYLGWQSGLRDINGAGETQVANGDVDFVLNMESIEFSVFKPTKERMQFRYINNPTRRISYTYDSENKVGAGSLSGPFKRAHVLDAVLGGITVVDQSTYDELTIIEGTRVPFFVHFEHGDKNIKDVIGCIGHELSINASESNIVTYDLQVMSAKSYEGIELSADFTAIRVLDVAPFHWKHVTTSLSVDGGQSLYTLAGFRNEVESVNVSISNEVEYKFAGGDNWASWYKEMSLTGSVDISLYPEDDVLWYFAQSESQYNEYTTVKGTLHYDGLVGDFAVGDTVTGADSGATGLIKSHWIASVGEGYLFIVDKTGTFESGEALNVSGKEADLYIANVEFGLDVTLTAACGLAQSTDYYIRVNGTQYTINMAAATPTYNDLIAELDLELLSGDISASATGSNDILLEADINGPETIIVTGGDSPNVLDNLTGFTAMEEVNGAFNGGKIQVVVTYQRAADDNIILYLKDLVMNPISEPFEGIDSGVDPITATLQIAREISDVYATAKDPVHDNSFSNPY